LRPISKTYRFPACLNNRKLSPLSRDIYALARLSLRFYCQGTLSDQWAFQYQIHCIVKVKF
jgi:hypothetical protein